MSDDDEITCQVMSIVEDVFSAMIDGEPGGVTLGQGPQVFTDPLHAWVDMDGSVPGRAALTAEKATCLDLARALMSLEPEDTLSSEDLIDAFGEVANVVGGNIKALIPEPGALSLPQVSPELPAATALKVTVPLLWQGQLIVISLWNLDSEEGE